MAARESLLLTRAQWVNEHLDRYADPLCESLWHDRGHSVHSTCPSCGRSFTRQSALADERQRLEGFAKRAEAYAKRTGWVKG